MAHERTEALVPGFWMNEASGVLRPAVEAYLLGRPMTPAHVAARRAYLGQWIDAPGWIGPEVAMLRVTVNALTRRADIDAWLDRALDAGIDPL